MQLKICYLINHNKTKQPTLRLRSV